jgi:hypothetical protein
MATWLITGCSTGLGRALATAVLDRGESVVVTVRDASRAGDLARSHPGTALALPLDVTDHAQISSVVRAAWERFGAIDVLVNNAGHGYRAAVEEAAEDQGQELFATNLFGPVALVKAVLPGVRERHSGTIVNISSACRLTCPFAPCLEGEVPLGRFPHVVAGCGAAVPGAWRAAGAGLAGFRCTGRTVSRRADVPEVPADPGGCEPSGRTRPLPGQPDVGGEGAGEAELGVAGDDQPGPPVRGGRVAELRGGPPQDLLDQTEGVLGRILWPGFRWVWLKSSTPSG